jgi:hypothetical protein
MALPHTGCNIFANLDFIRVPLPAASTTAREGIEFGESAGWVGFIWKNKK